MPIGILSLVLPALLATPVPRAGAEPCTLGTGAAFAGQPHIHDPTDDWSEAGNVYREGTDLERVWLERSFDGFRANVQVPSAASAQPLAAYRVLWEYGGTTWWVGAFLGVAGADYAYGRYDPAAGYVKQGDTFGSFHPGAPGTVSISVPLHRLGAPPAGSVLQRFRAHSGLAARQDALVVTDDTENAQTCDPLIEGTVGTGIKRCVGSPPRQTEDPMSPPCVAFFDDDNFGNTSGGVTATEILVLAYFDVGTYDGERTPPAGTYIDIDAPPLPPCTPATSTGCDHILVRATRALSRGLELRWQTYLRHVHFHAYFSGATSAAGRRADAADNWARIRPFAVVDYASENGQNEPYEDSMGARGTLVFSSRAVVPNSFYSRNAPLAWSFWPDAEHAAALFTSYVCTRVAGLPVAHSGNPQGTGLLNGRPRKFGLLYTTDPEEPGLQLFASLVRAGIGACGISNPVEATFPESGYVIDNADPGAAAVTAVARFSAAGVTTVLWLGGVEGKFAHAADRASYYPEIVIFGDLELDGYAVGRLQNQNVWQNVWGPALQIRTDGPQGDFGYRACREADPGLPEADARRCIALYRGQFMLFYAIQVAGPYLNTGTVDEGFHAMPERRSVSPYEAACYFDPGDYTCVKDATEVWWDRGGVPPGETTPGCMRMVQNGWRFRRGDWLRGDEVFLNHSDPCSAHTGVARFRVG